jgi:type II secretory pathway component PulF
VRYRTAAVLSIVLVGGMFGLPDAIRAAFVPSLEGLQTPVPLYERVLLETAFFCLRVRWLLALPIVVIVVALFAVAAFTSAMRARKPDSIHASSTMAVTPSSIRH